MDLINTFFGSPTKLRLLACLLKFQTTDLGERELARLSGVSFTALRHATKDLESVSFLQKKRVSHIQVWTLNQHHYYYPYVVKVIRTLSELPEYHEVVKGLLLEMLGADGLKLADKIYLFGSILQKDDFADIDLGVILKDGSKSAKESFLHHFYEKTGDVIQKLGKNMEAHVYTSKEWRSVKKTPLGQSITNGIEVYPS